MIVLHEVSKNFGQIEILQSFSHRVETGELLCIMGPSGIGKTTLLHLTAGLQKPDQGIVELDKASRVGYVFQEPRLLPWCTVAENVEIGLFNRIKEHRQRRRIVNSVLEKVDLHQYADFYPSQLSGGMKQRVALARAFAVEPDLLLLDEPFTALDHQLKDSLRKYLQNLLKWKPCTAMMVTHYLEDAVYLADRLIVMQGRPCVVAGEYRFAVHREERSEEYCSRQLAFLNKEITNAYKEEELAI